MIGYQTRLYYSHTSQQRPCGCLPSFQRSVYDISSLKYNGNLISQESSSCLQRTPYSRSWKHHFHIEPSIRLPSELPINAVYIFPSRRYALCSNFDLSGPTVLLDVDTRRFYRFGHITRLPNARLLIHIAPERMREDFVVLPCKKYLDLQLQLSNCLVVIGKSRPQHPVASRIWIKRSELKWVFVTLCSIHFILLHRRDCVVISFKTTVEE